MCDGWRLRGLLLAAGLSGVCSTVAHASDPLPATTSLVASTGAAAPTQSTFTITGPEDLVVTLNDLQTPAAFSSLSVAITQGGALAAGYTLSSQTPTVTLSAANGTYTISVFGVPNASYGAGTFSVCVAPSSTPANCLLPGAPSVGGNVASFSGGLSTESAASNPTLSTTTFTLVVTAAGSYTFNYADLAFPVALNSSGALSPNPNLGLFSGGQVVNDVNGDPGLGFSSGDSFNLNPGTYTLLAVAQANSAAIAGSYGITVTGPAGSAPLLNVTVPVGELNPPSNVSNSSQQSLTLTVTDYAFPGALAQASAMLTLGGSSVLSTTSTGGPVTTTVEASTLQLWNYGAASSTAGTYGVDVAAGSTDLFLGGYGVANSSSNYAYAFVTPVLTANTAYQASAVDLQFPSILSALSFAVAHDGTVTLQTGGSSTIDFTVAAARAAVVLVAASTPSTGSGLFDVDVQTTGNSPQLVFDQTQAVSSTPGFFDTRTVSVGTAGNYTVTLIDLQFPGAFANLDLAVTQGSQIFGKIFGGGNFTFAATPGTYRLTFVATPQASEDFGLYAVSMTYAAPTVTLTSGTTSAAAGTSITLNWTTTNATSCTASGGGFTGSITPGTGSESVTLSATTTYTLECTGSAGSASGSVTVTATSASSSSSASHSGGGAFGQGELVLWGMAAAAAARRRWRSTQFRRVA